MGAVGEAAMKKPQARIYLFPEKQTENALAIAEERRDRIEMVTRDIEAIMQALFAATHGDIARARFWLLTQLDLQMSALKQILAGE
jgi:hypothetical protein